MHYLWQKISRDTIVKEIGKQCDSFEKANFAIFFETPFNSNTTEPLVTTLTQPLTGPTPLPIRVKRGFLVRG